MSATTHGTAFIFGVDNAYLGATAQISNISLKKSDKINEFVENDSGQICASRHDDQTDALDITFKITASYTRNTMAAKLTLSGGDFAGDYRITSWDETKSSKGFVECKISAEKFEYLTLS